MIAVGYLLWLLGFTGAHRLYYGKPISRTIWFFTFGLFGIGWLIDGFLIPGMDRDASLRYEPGTIDYSLAWILLTFLRRLELPLRHGGQADRARIDSTHNLVEQARRFVAIHRRSTQGSRSPAGQTWCERIWTIFVTCEQQGHSMLHYLRDTVRQQLSGHPVRSLVPTTDSSLRSIHRRTNRSLRANTTVAYARNP